MFLILCLLSAPSPKTRSKVHVVRCCPPTLALPPCGTGACLGTGIERGKVGDILVTGEQGAQILVAPNMVEHLEQSLTQVGEHARTHTHAHAHTSAVMHVGTCLWASAHPSLPSTHVRVGGLNLTRGPAPVTWPGVQRPGPPSEVPHPVHRTTRRTAILRQT